METSHAVGRRQSLTLFALAEYLAVTPLVVELLVERHALPVVKARGRWWFRQSAVDRCLDLGMAGWHGAKLRLVAAGKGKHRQSLTGALRPANVLLDLRVLGLEDCFRQVVGALYLPPDVDRSQVLRGLVARERMCSTALDHGFAVPHTARDGARLIREHTVAFVRVLPPIRFAPKGKGLTDLFLFVFARDELAHLRLLARATGLARSLALADALRSASDARRVRHLLASAEEQLFGPGADWP